MVAMEEARREAKTREAIVMVVVWLEGEERLCLEVERAWKELFRRKKLERLSDN